ncbi:ATPase SWSAP1 [Mantella aurantiaca]
MSALLLRVFSELGGAPVPAEELGCVSAAGCGPQGAPVLLLGPPGSRKSGLLFTAALLGAEEGAVVFLAREPLQEMPRGGRAARDPLILKQIRFVYTPCVKDVLRFFSSLHVSSPPPSLILVDGLERYVPSSGGLSDAAHLCALMLDSASQLRCGLVVSAAPHADGLDGAFTAIEKYFPIQCRIHAVTSEESEGRSFNVSFSSPPLQWHLQVEQDGRLRVSRDPDKSPDTDAKDNT